MDIIDRFRRFKYAASMETWNKSMIILNNINEIKILVYKLNKLLIITINFFI